MFDLRRRNYLTYDGDSLPRQLGEVAVQGLELEALWQPSRATQLTAGYAYTPTSEVTRSADPAELGNNFGGTPRHAGSLWVDHRLAGGLQLGLGLRHTGSNHGSGDTAAARVPAYTLWDALLAYQTGPWDFKLQVRNLADQDYFAGCGYGFCYYGDPRRVTASATYRW